MAEGSIRAWTEVSEAYDGVTAFYVGVPPDSHIPLSRRPAARMFLSAGDAQRWVEKEAQTIGVSVEWVHSAVAEE